MRKVWPVFILATVVGIPAAVEANKNGSGGGQKGGGQPKPPVHHPWHHPGSTQGNHHGSTQGNHHGSTQGNKGGASVNVNVRVNVGSITPFGAPRSSRPSNPSSPKSNHTSTTKPATTQSTGTSTTKPPATNSRAVNVYTGVTINLTEYRPDWHHHHHHHNGTNGTNGTYSNSRKPPTTAGSTPGMAYSPGTVSMSSGYPLGTTSTGTGGYSSTGSGTSTNSGPSTTNTGTEEEDSVRPSTTNTNDVSVEENAGFFNVRGGAANLKLLGKQPNRQPHQGGSELNASFVSADGTESVQHLPAANQVRVVEQPEQGTSSITSSTQDTIGQPQPEKGTGLPVVPSLAGLLTFGAMAVVGWKKIF